MEVVLHINSYLSGLSLKNAAIKAGIDCYHATVSRMLQNKQYLGDEFYPSIIDEEIFEKARLEKQKRAGKLDIVVWAKGIVRRVKGFTVS